MSTSDPIYIVVGPTSSGKTSLALKLCKDFNGEIISADSRQVYKYMDLGTGKLPITSDNTLNVSVERKDTHWILDGVAVWGYDLVSPNEFYSGYDFAVYALNKAREIRDRGKTVFVVGGTGFYIDLFTKNVEPSNIEPNLDLRNELEKLSLEELQDKFKSITSLIPEGEMKIDLKNPVRLIRAIEKAVGTTKNLFPLPYFTDVTFKYIGLKSENSLLFARADVWVETMWKNGLVDEVKNLMQLGFENSPKLQGLVYKSVVQYLNPQNTLAEEQVKQLIKYDIHAYIRRQLTYFKRNKAIIWFDIDSSDYIKNIYNLING